jgi:hypothetical protein
MQKLRLSLLLNNANFLITLPYIFFSSGLTYLYENIFRVTTSYKQLFFTLLNSTYTFIKLFSTGQVFAQKTKQFKFFKKSMSNINPLVFNLRFSYVDFFKKLYAIECLNYSKKQYLFFKKLFKSIKTEVKFIIFKKTWQYTTQPVKRIKRRVTKLLKNL